MEKMNLAKLVERSKQLTSHSSTQEFNLRRNVEVHLFPILLFLCIGSIVSILSFISSLPDRSKSTKQLER